MTDESSRSRRGSRATRARPRCPSLRREAKPHYARALAALDVLRDGRRLAEAVAGWHVSGGIVGFGVGPKLVGGRTSSELALRVYVRRKRPRAGLAAYGCVPERLQIEGPAEGALTDVIEVGSPATCATSDRERPLHSGLSIGHCASGETGTIGALLRNGAGDLVLVSAAHVLAASGLGRVGDRISQPGGMQGGACEADAVATLSEWTPFAPGASFPNTADLAVARVDPTIGGALQPHPVSRLARPGDIVLRQTLLLRIGCMTGETPTFIDDMAYTAWMPYPTALGQWAWFGFRNLLVYRTHGLPGDSGGPLVTTDGALVGFHLGQVANGWGVATPVWALPPGWDLHLPPGGLS